MVRLGVSDTKRWLGFAVVIFAVLSLASAIPTLAVRLGVPLEIPTDWPFLMFALNLGVVVLALIVRFGLWWLARGGAGASLLLASAALTAVVFVAGILPANLGLASPVLTTSFSALITLVFAIGAWRSQLVSAWLGWAAVLGVALSGAADLIASAVLRSAGLSAWRAVQYVRVLGYGLQMVFVVGLAVSLIIGWRSTTARRTSAST